MQQRNPVGMILALLGIVLVLIGTFVPIACDGNCSDLEQSALFSFGRFEDSGFGFFLGMAGNLMGILPLIVAAMAIYPAVTGKGLEALYGILLVYSLYLFYLLIIDGDSDPSIGWVLLFGGVGCMIAGHIVGGRQPRSRYYAGQQYQPYDPYGQYQQPYGQQPPSYGQPPAYGQQPPYQPPSGAPDPWGQPQQPPYRGPSDRR
ncbi:MAG TPA: hypothetical protein VHP83_05740 [Aggregatilineaceae bacterium]|nr:hypothetical protein [Aggregatilineaceae bacterium]